jgi:Brp/Blh family beta-carotene 15,15'-monooxygenase
MILVGIPHGAVDHLLETGSWNLKKAPMFIINYLVLAGVIGVLWLFLPQIALIIFILYSMWHFGQADGKIWGFSSITSFLWGGSVLLYILGTHAQETNTILISMGSIPLPFEIPVIALIPWVLW